MAGPAAPVSYLWGLGALQWAIHLTDTRGEYAPPMLNYVLSPSGWEVGRATLVAAVAAIGWSVANAVVSRSGHTDIFNNER